MKKRNWITIVIILIVLTLAYFIINREHPETPEEIAKCIGENSELYTQLGCHACEIQKEIFGENYKYLNVVDCWFEGNLCAEKQIEATPTWIINSEEYRGAKSIEKLKELTGC